MEIDVGELGVVQAAGTERGHDLVSPTQIRETSLGLGRMLDEARVLGLDRVLRVWGHVGASGSPLCQGVAARLVLW